MRLFLLVILLISNLCFSQNQSVIDSLKNEIKYTETTEKDIELYQLLSKYYSKIEPNFDSAFDYKLAYYLSINHKHETEGKTDSLFIMSKKISNYIDSMKNIGYDKIDSNGLVFASYFNLANSYMAIKDTNKAKLYFSKMIESKYPDPLSKLSVLINLGRISSNFNEGKKYYDKAFKIIDLNQVDVENQIYIYGSYSSYCLEYNQLPEADLYLSKIKDFKDTSNNIYIMGLNALYAFKIKDYNASLNLYLDMLKYKNELTLFNKKDVLLKLSQTYSKLNNYQKALEYHQKYVSLKDSLFNEEKHKQIAELETKYQTEKKENENKELAYQNQLIEKEKQVEKQKSSFYLWGGIGLVTLLGLGGFLFYKQRKTRYENNQYKLEQKLLRSQMNPHFMSNFLMAIKLAVQKEDKDTATRYLDQFAKLSRQVLEASANDFILLEDEIDFLTNYLSLQKMVSHNEFDYQINLTDNIDETEIMIPPMLIQPFVENAIEHGFNQLQEKGKLDINFSIKENQIIAEVIDNGKGREANSQIKKGKYQSRATDITSDRILLFKKKWNKDILFDIFDQNIGTKVVFQMPIKEVDLA